ncbi:uncharacterized protein [Euwallacea fornicatus]|uniref:uncharacterized protein isoform X1 n=1 Tax=Euwallacea fornicatus TaxID=995702 RepID=UPI00338F767F
MSVQRDYDDAVALVGLLLLIGKKKRKSRQKWCKKWLLQRHEYSHVKLLRELNAEPKDYRNYLRMDETTYLKLLSMVTPLIQKQDTVMRKAISPHERLTATLRFLATGRTYECLKFSTRISPQALGKIIPETCVAIYKTLRKDYLKFPDSSDEWKEIARLFEKQWNFPHCLGAIDGKHIDIVPPAGCGSYYFNYKNRHSIVLLAIVDARYRFILADVGTNGRISDGGVLQNTKFFERMQCKTLKIPRPEDVANSSRCLPYVFVSDDAFPLGPNMLKPFRQTDLDTRDKKNFNYRLSRARHIVENAFGIMASRFRIYHTRINLDVQNIEKVVMTTCVLHNFLMTHASNFYAPENCFYKENTDNGTVISTGCNTASSNMEHLHRRSQGNITYDGKRVREEFQNYFVNEGKVPWQDNYICN